MKIIYPDEELTTSQISLGNSKVSKIFLAGTIDNDKSKDWQQELIDELGQIEIECNTYFEIYNPRRKNWDKNASKEIVEEQIKWEQDHLDKADLIIMVFSDESQSPISLLELGLYAESVKLLVFCTDKFWRYNNVHLTCEKYLIPLVNSTKTKDIIKEIKNIYKI